MTLGTTVVLYIGKKNEEKISMGKGGRVTENCRGIEAIESAIVGV